jgi:hypothetical protein
MQFTKNIDVFNAMILSLLISYWEKDSLIAFILFKLWLTMIFSPGANFGNHPLLLRYKKIVQAYSHDSIRRKNIIL